MILGEDVAMYEHSPELTVKEVAARDAEERYWEQVEKVSSNADQWRKEYVEEIKSYVQPTSSPPAAQTLPPDDLVDSVSETTPKDAEETTAPPGKSIIKRVQKGGLLRRARERRRFIVAALAVVACRRLFLAYFGSMNSS